MEITILSLPDNIESSGENAIFNQLSQLPSYKNLPEGYIKFKAKGFSKIPLNNVTSMIDDLNNLAKDGVRFLPGDYEFVFIEPANIVSSKENVTIDRVSYKETVHIGGVFWDQPYLADIIKMDSFVGQISESSLPKYQPDYFKEEEVVENNYTPPVILRPNLTQDQTLISELTSIKNQSWTYTPNKYKEKLIEILYYKKTGIKANFKSIENPELIYESYLKERRKPKVLGPELAPIEPEYGLDYLSFVNRANHLMKEKDTLVKQDIYFITKNILEKTIGLSNKNVLEETIHVVFILVQKLMIKKDAFDKKKLKHFDTQISLMINLYIICAVHCVQNILGIKIKRATDFFIDYFKDKNKESINLLGLTDNNIKKYYLDSINKVYSLLNEENIRAQEEERKVQDSLYQPTIEIKGPSSIIFGPRERLQAKYCPVDTYEAKAPKMNFKEFKEELFFDYYSTFCPKFFVHKFKDSVCPCGYKTNLNKTEREKYYSQYKDGFKNTKAKTVILKPQVVKPIVLPKKVSASTLDNKIKELSLSYKLPEAHIFNLTRMEGLKSLNQKTEAPITFNNLVKLKHYCLGKNIVFDLLNSSQTLEETFYYYKLELLSLLKRDELVTLIETEKKELWVDIDDYIAKKGIMMEVGKIDEEQEYIPGDNDEENTVLINENIIAEDIIKGEPEVADDPLFEEVDYEPDEEEDND